ncbi:elongation factor G [Litorilinea aerophila]|uniref:Elongation factor G n=1 Tax=Litorilinea aerophila TaxID=1204385 RepID=A0A540VGY4_9CHLR|nr:elongation factor G [Litorilinea aerophila]MCC9076418.1 elongation factor G [Litorilinea aerophila]OUC05193.1 elongation factor G [Litorilinea aerophila]GIV79096.1 MAG: elongation factor G [Litorilinea sp.]
MAKFQTDQIRNVAILGHSGSGKTTLTEALLYHTKVITRLGRVEDGTTVSDWDPEEHRRGISINLSVIPIEHGNLKFNLLDAPGYLDFVGEVISALHVAEAGLVLLDSVAGVEVGTELAWERLQNLNKPRIVFVNRMDRENANFQKAVESLRETFSDATIIPMQLPIGQGENFRGVVSLVSMKAYLGPEGKEAPIPEEMADEVEAARMALVEAAAETDDELIMKYLDGEELTPEEVRRGLHQGVKECTIVPVYCGSAVKGIGMERLLKALGRYVPAPTERSIKATQNGEEIELTNDPNGPIAAQVFKTIIDRYVGRMNYVRVFSGTIHKEERLINARTGNEARCSNLFVARGKDLQPTDQLVAGDIGVITKLDDLVTGDTLTTPAAPITIPKPEYPQPLYSVAITPATQADSAKMGHSVAALAEEDPTLRLEYVTATKQNVLQGMGETHVDVAVQRLEQRYGVKVETSIPKVPYQETISQVAQAQYRHKKQTGGAGQFAEVHMRVEPLETGAGFEYVSEVFGGAISSVFLPSIEKGVRQVMEQGVIAGYPVVDVKAVVYDGKEHPVDSKDIAFQTAGREVFKLAVQQANPVLLEPIYRIEVTVPEEYMGDVMSDFNTRRGRVLGMEQKNNRTVIRALVPLAEVLRYGTDLRSMTQGRGVYTMEFDHYEPVPRHLMDEIIAASKAAEQER